MWKRVTCLVCNEYDDLSLISHLKSIHKMSVGQYLKQFPDAEVASEAVHSLLKTIEKRPVLAASLRGPGETNLPYKTVSFAQCRIKVMEDEFPQEVKVYIPEEDFYFVPPTSSKSAIEGMEIGDNVYLFGPQGCGKTSLPRQYCALSRRPMIRFNCNSQLGVSDFEGQMEIVVDPANPGVSVTRFKLGHLPEAMRMGAVLVIEEIDCAKPGVLAVMQRVLENNSRELLIPQYSLTPIKAHSEFRIVATANTTGRGDTTGLYAGTQILNEAFLSRFNTFVRFSYLTADQEVGVIKKRFPGSDPRVAKRVVDWANMIRQATEKEEMNAVISTRDIVDNIMSKVVRGVSIREAVNLGFLNRLSREDFRVGSEFAQRCFAGS